MPDWKEEIRRRLAGLKIEPAREAEIVDEMAQHMDDRYEEAISTGATQEEALQAALAEMNDAPSFEQEPFDQEPLEQGLRRIEKRVEREIVAPASGSKNLFASLWQDTGRHAHARLRHWREYGHLQRVECRSAQAIAISECR